MKKILYSLSALALLLTISACTSIDNYDEPGDTIQGRIIDKTTGNNFITCVNDFRVRIWDKSWSDNPSPQDLIVKSDGTYQNTKLFSGTYDMQPYDGAFWPVEVETGIKLSGSLSKDFEVTPYLHVTDVTSNLSGNKLHLTCKLEAPITEGLPRVLQIKPFVSLNKNNCGNSVKIGKFDDGKYTAQINKSWSEIGDMTTGIGNQTYTLQNDLDLTPGLTYYIRLGVQVEDTYRKYNYSDVIEVVVP